tara:strand:- start:400 stop:660 length:261 start_codon:yes stop_codon:yes gene_type:complete
MHVKEMEYWMSKSRGGYTREELQDAFDKICNQENWKDCIKATIPTSEYRKADVAAVYFTGGGLEIVAERGDVLDVFGHGYYHHIGA